MCRKTLAFVFFICLGFFSSCKAEKENSLRIAVASNLQFVIGELVADFSEKTGIDCEVIIGSSGKLTAQIVEGAPFDLLLSADVKYPNELYDNGFTIDQPKIYAYGNLILWTVREGLKPNLDSLVSRRIKHIAVGNPRTAPYGVAAMQVLKNTEIYDSVSDKIVLGESVSQTNQFIISQAADLGFTSKSVVLSSKMMNRGSWIEIEDTLYEPMAQAMVVLKNRTAFKSKALQFKEFILSADGKKILHKFGYNVKE
ncbi:molybdate ABC transporter substrate-binding protein [Lutimonas halocynthiae]|uniref:molybdate ABC transporter substrate-binding protein n=1 Tax=Lutimonas halocynthiae TaxID=1446477 RepID=UPI0025B29CC4|nr:molybdate ABC transporter substrate-binding protein [Lutimonas halocynthiae]MDN3642473.1 molybdate ABC transporter substrate-binding protein [Lutimonas halocynthiae]